MRTDIPAIAFRTFLALGFVALVAALFAGWLFKVVELPW